MMKIQIETAAALSASAELLAVGIAKGTDALPPDVAKIDALVRGQISVLRASGDFRAAEDEALTIFPTGGENAPKRILLIGLGSKTADAERLRRFAGVAAAQARKWRSASVTLLAPAASIGAKQSARALAEGLVLGAYTFTELQSPPTDAPARVALDGATLWMPGADSEAAERGASHGEIVARAETLARDLGNRPGNIVTPSYLADVARNIATAHGMACTVLGRAELEAEGMRTLLAVSAGSDQEPKLIILEHRGGREGDAPLALVGKGLTFDAGGISIKPAAGMEEMKFDMCGGAATLAAMQAIAELSLPINVVGIVPSSENLLGGAAMRPGDIIKTHLGKTVEIVNTDAEGRLILADALSYARRFNPAAIVDCATLTGAAVIALGHEASAVMGTGEGLIDELRSAGDAAGERCWPLPLYDEYREQIKSTYADIKNTGGRPAGAITAGWFLREFAGDTPWAHLDIAGTSHGEGKGAYQSKGATGVPTRLLVEWVRARAG